MRGGSVLASSRRPYTPRTLNVFDSAAPDINIVVDGNSIMANFYTAIGSFDNHLMTVEPLASSGATHSSAAVSGASWADMIATHASVVDAAFVDGKTNILVLNETINSVFRGATVATIQTQIESYISARLAAHDWIVVYWLTVPYGGGSGYTTFNSKMDDVDAWVVANADTLGIAAVVDPRVLTVFDHDGTSATPFQTYNDDWNENTAPWIHPLDAPKLEVAALIVEAIELLTVTF